jgi:hypothetical protein
VKWSMFQVEVGGSMICEFVIMCTCTLIVAAQLLFPKTKDPEKKLDVVSADEAHETFQSTHLK